jgi:hypothetical protein
MTESAPLERGILGTLFAVGMVVTAVTKTWVAVKRAVLPVKSSGEPE